METEIALILGTRDLHELALREHTPELLSQIEEQLRRLLDLVRAEGEVGMKAS